MPELQPNTMLELRRTLASMQNDLGNLEESPTDQTSRQLADQLYEMYKVASHYASVLETEHAKLSDVAFAEEEVFNRHFDEYVESRAEFARTHNGYYPDDTTEEGRQWLKR